MHHDDQAELEKKLEEIQKEKQEEEVVDEDWSSVGADNDLLKKIQELEIALKNQTEITKRAQYEYYNLKLDFDRYQEQMKEKSSTLEIEILISTVKKFLPFVENLRKSLATIPEDQYDSPLVKWLHMMYGNFLKTLEWMHIKAIESVWLAPDSFLHEPVSVQPVEDENMKWKIVQEFERGFYYEKGWDKRVVVTSKVVVGQ